MVTGLECSCGLCDSSEHAGFLQGVMVLSHRFPFTTVYTLHIPSLQKKERLVVESLNSMT